MTPLSLTEAEYTKMLKTPTKASTSHYTFDKSLIRDSSPGLESNTVTGNPPERITENPKEGTAEGQPQQITVGKQNQGWWKVWWNDLWDIDDIHTGDLPYFTSRATIGKEASQQATGYVPFFKRPFKAGLSATVAFTLGCHQWMFGVYAWAIGCLLYNGIYLVAWQWYFPTSVEKIAWRACTAFTFVGFVALILNGLFGHVYWLVAVRILEGGWKPPRVVYRVGVRIINMTFLALIGPWILAKLFVFAESLISLRKLPLDTYGVVEWTSLLPHV